MMNVLYQNPVIILILKKKVCRAKLIKRNGKPFLRNVLTLRVFLN